MTVKEYALDVNLSIAEILSKCVELGINVKNGEDILSDDDIIMLDNTINLISSDEEITAEEEDSIDSKVDEIMTSSNLTKDLNEEVTQEKLKKRDTTNLKDNFNVLKKAMYKHKNKLLKNKNNENIIIYTNEMTVKELADKLNVAAVDIITKLVSLGLMLNINDVISFENAEIIALEYNKTLKKEETQDIANFEELEIIDQEEDLMARPPIITIMGHVDHGKTTLLDYIRNTHIVASEFGGITQHIGAYQTKFAGEKLTFIDTPGHEAFTEMRARGASVTDIVIIVVAADDGVKPQTKEAIDHALSANVPIIVALNKIDKKESNIEKVMTEINEAGLTPETWGGEYPVVNISAKTGEGVDLLLKTILTISEIKGFKANPKRYATGTVIESRLDKNVGGIASFLIQNGTLRIGDPVVVGSSYAKIRTMKNDQGEFIVEAGPSTPVEITGLSENPQAGDKFMAFETETEAKNIATKRKELIKYKEMSKKSVSLDDLFAEIDAGNKEINIVLKADVRGSEEAVKNALEKVTTKDVKVKVIRSGIGAISENDIILANASHAIVIGFNVIATNIAKDMAKDHGVEIRLYTVIYKLLEDIEAAINGLLEPVYEEKIIGTVEIRKIFKFSKVGNIAGSYVKTGVIKSNANARVIRDGIVISSDDKISSLQHGKEQVKEVKKGFECGITLEKLKDIRENDLIEVYEMVEVTNE